MPEPTYANAPARICPVAESRAQQIADLFEAEPREILSLSDDQTDDAADTDVDPFADQNDDDFYGLDDGLSDLQGSGDYD